MQKINPPPPVKVLTLPEYRAKKHRERVKQVNQDDS